MSDSTAVEPDASGRDAFGASLTRLRESRGLTVRGLARAADVPLSTVGDYVSGKHLPSAGQLGRFRAILTACGVTAPDEVRAWTDALGIVRAERSRRGPRQPSPYPGLESFDVTDADRFFGRADEVDAVLTRLHRLDADPPPGGALLAVVGPSGSGKSSLLRAGVAAAITGGRADGPDEQWECAVVTPGSDPSGSLAAALTAVADAGRGIVVVDQFEEIFTAVPDAAVRSAFLRDLSVAARTRALVVVGMRADFYAAATQEPVLLPALQHAQVVVGPLTAEHLREAITAPAEQAGVVVEDGLVDLLLADLSPHDAPGQAHDAGALPLLSHALLATWERSDGERLTVADYRATGGIDGAVQRTAEQLYDSLTPAQQQLARRVFVRLVHLDDVAVTRRRVSRTELAHLESADADVGSLVARFVDARLLTASQTLVEISHEALLTAWPRLHEWVDADRAGLRQHRQLTNATIEWERTSREPSLLMRGGLLEAALHWVESDDHVDELTTDERDYVDAARAQRDADRALTRRRQRRLRRLLAVAVVLAVVAVGLSVYAFHAQNTADRNSASARAARDSALSGQVALEATQLQSTDPALSQQLAVAAYRIQRTPEALRAVIDASTQPPATRITGQVGYTPLSVDPSGLVAAVGQATSGVVKLVSLGSDPHVLATLPAPGRRDSVLATAFTATGHRLVVLGSAPRIQVWDVAQPENPRLLSTTRPAGLVPRAAVVVGRTLFVGGTGERPMRRYTITAQGALSAAPDPATIGGLDVQSLAVSPDGSRLAAADRTAEVVQWSLRSPTSRPRVARSDANLAFSVLYSATRLYLGTSQGDVVVYDPATMHRTATLSTSVTGWTLALALSPDGRTLGVGSSDSTFRQFDTATLRRTDSAFTTSQVNGVSYLRDGSGVVTTTGDGGVYIERFHGRQVSGSSGASYNLSFSRDGSRLAVAYAGGIRIWRTAGAVPTALSPPIAMTGTSATAIGTGGITADGRTVAMGNFRGQVQLVDVRDPAHPRMWGPPFQAGKASTESVFFSPVGHTLAVAGDDHLVSLWDVTSPANPRLLSRQAGTDTFYSVAWSPNGRLLAAANVDSHVYLWSVASLSHPRLLARLGGFVQEVWGVNFSPNGRLLAASGSDRTTRLWDVSSPAHPRPYGAPFVGATDYAYAPAFSPNGRLLAVGSNDRQVRLYDLRSHSRSPLASLTGVDGAVFSVAFDPADGTLVASGRSSAIPVWTVDPAAFARRVCREVGSPISRAEWAQYVPGIAYDPPCR